jgi:ribonuclease HII
MLRKSIDELKAQTTAGPPYSEDLLAMLQADPRAGVRALYVSCLRAQTRALREEGRLEGMMRFEHEAAEGGFKRIAGVDEAGRGPLAGPIVAAAVVLGCPVAKLNDSKQLTPQLRAELFEILAAGPHAIGVAIVEADFIDREGIQCANYAAMAEAVGKIEPAPDFLLVDGFRIHGCPLPQNPLIKGDSRSASIAAASIMAKVTRDRIMDEYERRYPGYGFAGNKGYATREHVEALECLGPCPIHRRSFSPVTDLATTGLLFDDV